MAIQARPTSGHEGRGRDKEIHEGGTMRATHGDMKNSSNKRESLYRQALLSFVSSIYAEHVTSLPHQSREKAAHSLSPFSLTFHYSAAPCYLGSTCTADFLLLTMRRKRKH